MWTQVLNAALLIAAEEPSQGMLTKLFLHVAYVGSEWVLWLWLLVNFISVATIVDRVLYFRRTKVDGESLGSQLDQFLRAGDVRGAWTLVSENEAIECAVVAAGLAASPATASSRLLGTSTVTVRDCIRPGLRRCSPRRRRRRTR